MDLSNLPQGSHFIISLHTPYCEARISPKVRFVGCFRLRETPDASHLPDSQAHHASLMQFLAVDPSAQRPDRPPVGAPETSDRWRDN